MGEQKQKEMESEINEIEQSEDLNADKSSSIKSDCDENEMQSLLPKLDKNEDERIVNEHEFKLEKDEKKKNQNEVDIDVQNVSNEPEKREALNIFGRNKFWIVIGAIGCMAISVLYFAKVSH